MGNNPFFMSSHDTMCQRCDGLCCRVYDIFDSATGTLVKKWWQKCGYLDIKNRCRIYETRKNHAGYRESCDIYDCMEGWPIVTIFARRLDDAQYPNKFAIIASLLETIRMRVVASPESREQILLFSATLLNALAIDDSLSLATRLVRIKIERWTGEDTL